MVRQKPGQNASRGAISMYLRPSLLSMPPQLGTSGGRPNPRKLKEASATMFAPTDTEEKIWARLPVTIELGVMALVIGVLIAVPVGIYSAIRRNTAADYAGRTIAIMGLATPNFWLGTMVMIYPAIWWACWACPPVSAIREW